MDPMEALSRRRFLASAGAAAAGSALRISAPALAALGQAACSARDDGSAYVVLGSNEAADFSAIAARIIPTTDTPGATEAGVIHFFDRAFADHLEGSLAAARAGLDALNAGLGQRFATLDAAAQDSAIRAIEGDGFFELMRVMTIFGFFAMRSHGGNKDNIGWQLVGFDGDRGAWLYPFGHYDAQVHRRDADDQ